jgi:hypothetical protein
MPPDTAATLADRMAALAAKPTDKVTILGQAEIELLLALSRMGFAEVTCRDVARGPHIASDPADIVVAPAVKGEAELERAVKEAGRSLRRNGLFVARLVGLSNSALSAVGEIFGRYGLFALPEAGNFLCWRRLAGPVS